MVVLLVGSVLFFTLKEKEKEPIKIGALLPLTGVGGESGKLLRDGIFTSLEEVNSRGGINGRPVEVVIKDTEADPEVAKRVFQEMEDEVKPVLYISALSRIGTSIGPLAEEAEAPMLVLVATSDEVTKGKDWVFKFPQSASAELPPSLFHFEKLGIKRLGILYVNDAFGLNLFKAIGDAFEETGGIVESISFEADELDFREYIVEVEDTDAIYFLGLQNNRRAFFPQVAESDYSGYLIGPSDVSNEIGIEGTEGAYVATPGLFNPANIVAREKGYGDVYSASGYDGMSIFAYLLEGEEITRENVREVLDGGFTYSSVWGILTVQSGDHDFVGPLLPAQIVDGEFEFLG